MCVVNFKAIDSLTFKNFPRINPFSRGMGEPEPHKPPHPVERFKVTPGANGYYFGIEELTLHPRCSIGRPEYIIDALQNIPRSRPPFLFKMNTFPYSVSVFRCRISTGAASD